MMLEVITSYLQNELLTQLELLFRIIVAGGCGLVIGLERKNRLKNAGLKTHLLIAVTSALMVVISKYGFFDVLPLGLSVDASRVAASVASGIGFLGAGLILAGKHGVIGVTTAAGVWATVGIGMALGAGMYFLGIATTIFIIVSQVILHKEVITSRAYFGEHVEVILAGGERSLEQFQQMLLQHSFEMMDIKVKSGSGEEMDVRFAVRVRGFNNISRLADLLKESAEVQSFSLSKLS